MLAADVASGTEVGERVDYDLVRSESSPELTGGQMRLTVSNEGEFIDYGYFTLSVDAKIKTVFGSKSVDFYRDLDEYYFTPDFLDDVRAAGSVVTRDFTVSWLRAEEDCDRILFHNLRDTIPARGVKVETIICQGVPVIGARWIKVSGNYYGKSLEAVFSMR